MAANALDLPEVRGFDFWGARPAVYDLCAQDDFEVLLAASAAIPTATKTSATACSQFGRTFPTNEAACPSGFVATASNAGKPESSPLLAR